MAVVNAKRCPRAAAGLFCSGRGGQGRNPKGCPRPCGGGSGFVHAWNGPPGAALEYQRKRPRRAVGGLGFLHFPVAELLNKGRQSGFNLGQNILIVQNWRVQRVMQFQRINANG